MIDTGLESTAYFGFENYEEGISLMRKHGYTAMDYQGLCPIDSPLFSMSESEFKEYLTRLRKVSDDNGIKTTQLHGLWVAPDRTAKQREKSLEYFIKDIKGASILGCKNVVIHPFLPFGWGAETDKDKIWDVNIELFGKLLPIAQDFGVTICAENQPFTAIEMSSVAGVKELVRELDSPNIKVCFDTGHANVFHDDIAADVRLLGEDLACLHVHDNKGNWDQHLIPYQGNIDWDGFLSALNEIGYKGTFSLETYISPKMPEPMLEEMRVSLSRLAAHMAKRLRGK